MIRAVDLFAGGGGASEGIRLATGTAPVVAVNHCPHAIAMHAANHPGTRHLCESLWTVRPRRAVRGSVDLLWASPDCTHFSRAKGGKPCEQRIRGLAWIIVEWARAVRPRVIAMENVPEFVTWGPLDDDGQPIRERRGETFAQFVGELGLLGYRAEWRNLVAADYGAPTSRKRFFLVARCDGEPISWPEPIHGPGRALPWRTAAECIDWSLPCPSIFERKKPLAEATRRRIAEGVRRFVLGGRPFLVHLTHGGRASSTDEPLRTVTAANRGEQAPIAPTLIQAGYGERPGRAPRVLDLGAPLGTVVGGGNKHALVSAFLSRHFTGVVGRGLDAPLPTVTAVDHHSLGAVFLDKLHGSALAGQELDAPAPTATGGGGRGGGHAALVAVFLVRYYGQGGQWGALGEPMHTIVSKARLGLVTVDLAGEEYVLDDIGMRMLAPRELARAQGFADGYVLTGTKSQQIARIGNSVPPPVVAAVVRAQFPEVAVATARRRA